MSSRRYGSQSLQRLLGHWLEMASVAKAENALDAISKLLPDKAEKLVNGKRYFFAKCSAVIKINISSVTAF